MPLRKQEVPTVMFGILSALRSAISQRCSKKNERDNGSISNQQKRLTYAKKLKRKALWKGPECQRQQLVTAAKRPRLSKTSKRAHERLLSELGQVTVTETFKSGTLANK